MAKLGEFINSLALKSGVAVDNEKLKAFLSDPVCSTFEVDSTLVESINKGLMTEDAAINNPLILNRARAEAYNKVDETISKQILDLLDESDKAEVIGKKYTVDRVTEIGKVITKLKEAKKDSGSSADKAVFQKQIDDLQSALKQEKLNGESQLTQLKSAYENESIENNLKLMLNGRNYRLSMATEQDKQFAIDAALLKVKQELNAKGYKVVRENGQPKLVTSENLKVYEGGNEIPLHNFIDGAIAQLIAPVPASATSKSSPADGGGSGVTKNVSAESAFAEFYASVEK